jgi:monothiol bacilliredoxin
LIRYYNSQITIILVRKKSETMITKYKIKSDFDWQQLKENLNSEILIFKYSPMCGVSFSVERKFNNWLENLPGDEDLICARLNVITARALSREIAEELGITHESPQLIWLDHEGKVKWHASHYDITEDELNTNLKS